MKAKERGNFGKENHLKIQQYFYFVKSVGFFMYLNYKTKYEPTVH